MAGKHEPSENRIGTTTIPATTMRDTYQTENDASDPPVIARRQGWTPSAISGGRVIQGGVGLTLTIGVVALVWWLADWSHLLSALLVLSRRPELLAAFLLSYTCAFALRAVAWRQIMANGGSVFSLFTYLQAALLANHLLPFKLGEAARPLLAARRALRWKKRPLPLGWRDF